MTNEWKRFFKLRQRVFDAIRRIVEDPEDDGYHKSYEGAMDVTFSFDNYFNSEYVKDIACVTIALHCYLLGHEEWYGDTFAEALDKAERGIEEIVSEYEDDRDTRILLETWFDGRTRLLVKRQTWRMCKRKVSE